MEQDEPEPECPLCNNLSGGYRAFQLDQADTSAAAGCHGCRLLVAAVDALEPAWTPDVGSREEAASLISIQLHMYSNVWPPTGFSITWPKSTDSENRPSTRQWHITCSEDSPLAWRGRIATARGIASHSSSESAFRVMQSWLADCVDHHEECAGGPSSDAARHPNLRPKRLVDVSPPDAPNTIRLRDSEETDGSPYVALSYCWGGMELFMTTRETYEQRLQDIDLDRMPPTFMDAVTICRRLGIRYLWIDALCIIQHDREDWESEVPRMGDIYGNAYLVIAATLSRNPTDGIFSRRPPSYCFDFELDDRTYPLCIKEELPHKLWITPTGFSGVSKTDPSMPLLGRGWAFQERMLATRIVHYTPRELVWECPHGSQCECMGIHWQAQHPVQTWSHTDLPLMVQSSGASLRALDSAGKDRAWREVIMEYSERKFSEPQDRLPALSSLTRQFHIAAPELGDYLAGMWSNTLPDSLVWREDRTHRRPEPGSFIENQSVNRIPSWSWSSCGGVVQLSGNGAPEVRVIEAHCTPATADPYGAVLSGYIDLEGQLGEITSDYHRDNLRDRAPDTTERGEPLFALKVEWSDWNIWYAIILKRSQEVEGAFERVTIDTAGDSTFEGVERTRVRIV